MDFPTLGAYTAIYNVGGRSVVQRAQPLLLTLSFSLCVCISNYLGDFSVRISQENTARNNDLCFDVDDGGADKSCHLITSPCPDTARPLQQLRIAHTTGAIHNKEQELESREGLLQGRPGFESTSSGLPLYSHWLLPLKSVYQVGSTNKGKEEKEDKEII